MSTLTSRETGREGVMRACTDLLTAERVWWMRCNSGAFHNGKRPVFFGRKGMADLLGLVPMVVGDLIRVQMAVWIETKAPRGKQTKEQREFQREVEAEGHTYLLIDDPTQLQTFLKEHR
jgi:hypothetical protein